MAPARARVLSALLAVHKFGEREERTAQADLFDDFLRERVEQGIVEDAVSGEFRALRKSHRTCLFAGLHVARDAEAGVGVIGSTEGWCLLRCGAGFSGSGRGRAGRARLSRMSSSR